MKFVAWTWYHYLFIVSPFIIIGAAYFLLKNKSDRARYLTGAVIGVISLLILIIRNVDIYLSSGMHPEIMPLQVCHFGNIAVFFALVFRSKIATAMAWCLNLIPAFSSLIVVDALVNYQTILAIRPQAYIWGHLFIIVGAMYAVLMRIVTFDFKAFLKAVAIVFVLLLISVAANTYVNDYLERTINYFYIYNSRGVPFGFLYKLSEPITIGNWFTLNPMYVLSITVLGFIIMYGLYLLQRVFNRNYQN